MKVICIDNKGGANHLTVGCEYDVIKVEREKQSTHSVSVSDHIHQDPNKKGDEFVIVYTIRNDMRNVSWYNANDFVSVVAMRRNKLLNGLGI